MSPVKIEDLLRPFLEFGVNFCTMQGGALIYSASGFLTRSFLPSQNSRVFFLNPCPCDSNRRPTSTERYYSHSYSTMSKRGFRTCFYHYVSKILVVFLFNSRPCVGNRRQVFLGFIIQLDRTVGYSHSYITMPKKSLRQLSSLY